MLTRRPWSRGWQHCWTIVGDMRRLLRCGFLLPDGRNSQASRLPSGRVLPYRKRLAPAVLGWDVLQLHAALLRFRVLSVLARQRVSHRLGGAFAVLAWLSGGFVWRVGVRAMQRRHLPARAERDVVPAV